MESNKEEVNPPSAQWPFPCVVIYKDFIYSAADPKELRASCLEILAMDFNVSAGLKKPNPPSFPPSVYDLPKEFQDTARALWERYEWDLEHYMSEHERAERSARALSLGDGEEALSLLEGAIDILHLIRPGQFLPR